MCSVRFRMVILVPTIHRKSNLVDFVIYSIFDNDAPLKMFKCINANEV